MKKEQLMEKAGLIVHSISDLRRKTINILQDKNYNEFQIGLICTGINGISTDEQREIVLTLDKVFISSTSFKFKNCFIEKITFILDRGWFITINNEEIICTIEVQK